MEYNKPVMWDGKDLTGAWLVTYKVDGIRAFKRLIPEKGVGAAVVRAPRYEVVSRNGKPLYNLDHLKFTDAEVFLGTFSKTVTACRTKNTKQVIPQSAIFSLSPITDGRLIRGFRNSPSAKEIWAEYKRAVLMGFEGLVLREMTPASGESPRWLKVKKKETVDVTITGFYEGKGKHKGKLGGFVTSHGRVGTGLTDQQRAAWSPVLHGRQPKVSRMLGEPHIGMTIECECMELTPAGKMRKPRFIRLRPDK